MQIKAEITTTQKNIEQASISVSALPTD